LLVGLAAAWLLPGLLYAQTPASALTGPEARLSPIGFHQILGWNTDSLDEVWPAFLANCQVMQQRYRQWGPVCRDAQSVPPETAFIRQFFETRFTAYQLRDEKGAASATITGYYEPLLKGARSQGGPYQYPLYRTPSDLIQVDLNSIYPQLLPLRLRGRVQNNKLVPYPTRAEIETQGLLRGQELFWVDDPIDAFFLQVQGSGRIQLPDGQTVRVGYAEQNGYPYRSIGRWLVERGELKLSEASMQGIKAWVAANPGRRDELLHQNPSMVFFREMPGLRADQGPPGTMGLPLTAGRSLAVDQRFVVMGTPVFLMTELPRPGARPADGALPYQRLMLAQDTGSAILGAHRGDIFFGTGFEAGEVAGRMRASGAMVVLLPK